MLLSRVPPEPTVLLNECSHLSPSCYNLHGPWPPDLRHHIASEIHFLLARAADSSHRRSLTGTLVHLLLTASLTHWGHPTRRNDGFFSHTSLLCLVKNSLPLLIFLPFFSLIRDILALLLPSSFLTKCLNGMIIAADQKRVWWRKTFSDAATRELWPHFLHWPLPLQPRC